jgi:hypothetical protein
MITGASPIFGYLHIELVCLSIDFSWNMDLWSSYVGQHDCALGTRVSYFCPINNGPIEALGIWLENSSRNSSLMI